jgi:Ser/Thr protein kinase RdoA (MazF antagonist)
VDATRPFVDRPVGDAAPADRAAFVAARRLGLSPPERIRVGMNALYRCGDVVLRVGRTSASPSAGVELAHRLLDAGLPVPTPATDQAVVEGDLAVTAWRRLDPLDAVADWHAIGRIVRRVHALSPSDLPPAYPLPSPTGFPWWQFDEMVRDVGPDIDPPALAGIAAAIERHRDWVELVREHPVVCHGDVHPGNVMMTADGPVLLDWDLMCVAAPGWDHAMLLTVAERWGGDAAVYPAFAAGYGADLRGDPGATAFAALRNVAATLMRVRAGRTDLGARAEAERRLRFWRGDPDAPSWRAQ